MQNDELTLAGAPVVEASSVVAGDWMALCMGDSFRWCVQLLCDFAMFVVVLCIFLFFI